MKNTGIKSATAGLAGAMALAGGTQAYGATVSVTPPANFVPTSGVTNPANASLWDVNGDGTTDFALTFYQVSTTGNWTAGIYGYGGVGVAASSAYVGAYVTYSYRLSAGATVGSSSLFNQTTGYVAVLGSRYGSKFYGQFVNHTNGNAVQGWVGFEFTAADGIHYGALELTTSRYKSATNPGGITFQAAIYNTTPGASVTIPGAIPEPSTLAALAFGATGLAAGIAARRRKQAAGAALPA